MNSHGKSIKCGNLTILCAIFIILHATTSNALSTFGGKNPVQQATTVSPKSGKSRVTNLFQK
jgi:hypothetical protein